MLLNAQKYFLTHSRLRHFKFNKITCQTLTSAPSRKKYAFAGDLLSHPIVRSSCIYHVSSEFPIYINIGDESDEEFSTSLLFQFSCFHCLPLKDERRSKKIKYQSKMKLNWIFCLLTRQISFNSFPSDDRGAEMAFANKNVNASSKKKSFHDKLDERGDWQSFRRQSEKCSHMEKWKVNLSLHDRRNLSCQSLIFTALNTKTSSSLQQSFLAAFDKHAQVEIDETPLRSPEIGRKAAQNLRVEIKLRQSW